MRGLLPLLICIFTVCSCASAPSAQAMGFLFGRKKTVNPPKSIPTYPGSHQPRPPFEVGVNIHLDDTPLVGEMADMGAKWVRIDMNWSIMEAQEGNWNFQPFDSAIQNAQRYGLKIFANIGYTPSWASASGLEGAVPPQDRWEAFVRTAVERYRGSVDAFGIWNEPNLSQFWSGTADEWVEVVLKPACSIIRGIDPSIKIVSPDTAHLYKPTIDVGVFYKTITAHGAGNCLDVIAHHIYAEGDFDQRINGFSFAGITYKPGIKQWLEKAGLFGKPVWITEFGYDVKTSDPAMIEALEAKQAKSVTDQLKIMAKYYWIHKAFIFERTDPPEDGPYKYGITRIDGSIRPVFFDVQALIRSGQLF